MDTLQSGGTTTLLWRSLRYCGGLYTIVVVPTAHYCTSVGTLRCRGDLYAIVELPLLSRSFILYPGYLCATMVALPGRGVLYVSVGIPTLVWRSLPERG